MIYNNIDKIPKISQKKLINVFNQILELDIEKIYFNEKVQLNSISEYKFWMYTANIVLKNQKEANIFLKFIEKDKIKQSIYCYWNIFTNEVNKKEENKNNINDYKVLIFEEKKEKYKNILFLKPECKQNEFQKYQTKIYLTDIQNFFINRENLGDFNKYKEKILFIGLTL